MMLSQLLTTLRDLNVQLYVEEGNLKCKAPKDALNEEIRSLLKSRKKELIELLSQAGKDGVTDITPTERIDPIPLSYAQQRLWFLDQFEGAGAAYHIPVALRLQGPLDRNALQASLDRIVARHESLRTRFANTDGRPVQVIAEAAGFGLQTLDLRALAQDEQEAEIERQALATTQAPFDLGAGPLIRGRLLQLADEDHRLIIALHHIIADGWSLGVLINELTALYAAYRQGRADPLPPPAIQYADYAQWQRQWLAGDTRQAQLGYWTRQLAGAPALLALPTDRPRPPVQRYAGAGVNFTLDAGLSAGLKALAKAHHATLHMLLTAGWAILLAKLSGQDDLVIGTPVANRPRPELEGLIGFFVNTLALRIDLSGNPRVHELIGQIRDMTLTAYSHQDVPFEQVVEALNPPRSMSHSPVFQVMLALQNAPLGELQLPELSLTPHDLPVASAQFDLTLSLREAGDTLVGGLHYATDLFERRTIERWLGHFKTVLAGLVRAAGQPIGELPWLSAEERHQVLVEFNATAAAYPRDQLIHQLFEAQAAQQPDAVAVVFEDRQLTYGELNARANRLAHELRARGVGPDVLVAICIERSLEMVVGLLAVLKAGGAYVPLDPAYPADRLAYMLADAAPRVLLTQERLRDSFPATAASVIMLDRDWRMLAEGDDTNLAPQALGLTPRHLAYVIYTSGSTGQPKGVMVEQGGLCNLAMAQIAAFSVQPHSRVLQFASFSFDACASEIAMALCSGASLYLASRERLLPGEPLLDTLRMKKITHVTLPPIALSVLPSDRVGDALTTLIVAGDTCPSALVRQWAPNRRFINAYGPTEASVCASLYRCDPQDERAPAIGRPIANTRIYILDDRQQPLPVGVTGELHIGGAGVARGYLNRPALTAERFIKDPFSHDPEARLYRTGDLGCWRPDGTIEFLGRNDHQVKLRGFRIELGEIEAQLMACPDVREAVVIAREDRPGDKRLVAYLTALADAELDIEALRTPLKALLPEYMLPSAFVILDALPLTPNGKLDRQALPAPEADAYGARGYETPVGEAEMTLARLWAELLQVERVGRQAHFFELGGHSLLAVTLIERMRQAGLPADVRTLFATPTLAALAAATGSGSGLVEVPANRIPPGCPRITPDLLPLVELDQTQIDAIVEAVPGGAANVQDIYPLAPLQEGILFHHLMESEGDAYLLPALLAFDTAERLQETLAALQAVITRHDILRTAMAWEGLPEPVQVVWREAPLAVEEIVLDPEAGDAAAQLKARFDPHHYRLDVRQAPLLRAQIAQDAANGRWLLVLLMHHLALDHTALDLLLAETGAYLQGQADRLPTPLPFRNFVAQARLGISREAHEAFFRGMLGDVNEPTAPFGLLDVLGNGSQVQEARLTVATDLARRTREQARTVGVSVASLFHLAWGQVLARTTGRDDVVFGTVLFGRMQGGEGADRVLGLFINTLPVRLEIGDAGVADSVRRTHALLADVLRHEHAPLALAQRCSAVPAPAPLFSALLNYRHSQIEASADSATAWQGIEILSGEERTNYPIVLAVDDLGEGFSLTAQTVSAVTPERLCAMMHTALENLLTALETAPDTAMRRISALPDAERRQVLYDWNATQSDYPQDCCIHELFEAQVRNSPDDVAVVFEDQELTYAELNVRANQLAHYLRAHGIGPDSLVAICMERSLEMVVGLLGILKAGGAYVPLDPTYPTDRLTYTLEDSAPVLLLTQGGLITDLLETTPTMPVIDLGETALWSHQPIRNIAPSAVGLASTHLAYVIYTSGSTGQPKGVMASHRALYNHTLWMQEAFPLEKPDYFLQKTAIGFDASVWELFSPLSFGAVLVLVPPHWQEDIGSLLTAIRKHKVTMLQAVPGLLQLLLDMDDESALCSLKRVFCGGEALPAALAQQCQSRLDAELINLYGPTETCIDACFWICPPNFEGASTLIGQPIANTRIYILDDRQQPVPIGVAGELYIGGAGVARGYLNRPELTAERFLEDPFSPEPGGRMYRTGDLGRWREDGTIEFLGRNDHQVKIRGFRIEPGEIEARLMACAGVREAFVIAREDRPGDKRLVAYLTALADAELDIEALRAPLKAVLPEYMLPSAFVILDALPLTPNGKLDRQALPAPEAGAYGVRAYEAPVDETEQALAAIWQAILPVERVGRHDHFFDLGGHSLLAVQAIARIRQDLGCGLALRDLFAHPVLQDLAGQLPRSEASPWAPIGQADRGQSLPLSYAQQRLWFLDQFEGAGAAYHIPVALRLQGPLDRNALQASLDRIVARHESLRTRFANTDGRPVQVIAEAAGFGLQTLDLRALAQDEQEAEIERQALATTQAPFDLGAGPLIRGRLLQLADEDHRLIIALHHIIADGWSLGVLINELTALYAAYRQGRADPLPPPAIQYADYAQWQRQWLAGDTRQAQLGYWTRQLAGAPALLELPTDRPRPPVQRYAGAGVSFTLDAGLSAGLKALAKTHNATLHMLLTAGWAILLAKLSGQDDLVIGTPVANRPRPELEGLIGFFVNTLALRVDLSGNPRVHELIGQIRDMTLAAYSHQDVPFEQVVEALNPPRSMSHSPVFQVMLALQNAPLGELQLPELTLTPHDLPLASAQFDLTLSLREAGDTLVGGLHYATDLFERRTIERWLGHFKAVLAGLVREAGQPIGELPWLSAEERRQVLVDFNATATAYPQDRLIHELFEAQAAQRPDAVALVFEDRQLTYGELNARANRLAHHLRGLGVKPDDRVAICIERGLEMVIGLLAILKAGGAYVPLDPAYPAERLAYMLADAAPKVLLTQERLRDSLPATAASVIMLDRDWKRIAEQAATNPDPQALGLKPQHQAYVIYTSGSTGQPKGVMVEHRNIANLLADWSRRFASTCRSDNLHCSLWTSFSFDVSVFETFSALASGGALHLVPGSMLGDPEALFDWLSKHHIVSGYLPPFFVRYLNTLSTDRVAGLSLERVLVGVEPLDESGLYRIQYDVPNLRIVNGYGPTEATVFCTAYAEIGNHKRNAPIGSPIANMQIYILDDRMQPVPVGVAGELHIGGAGVARGYLNRPELTAERFIKDPFSPDPEARLYRTGDLGRWREDGTIEFLGRNDCQVKLRGFRIEPGEIEARLMACAGVREAVVMAREDRPGDKRLVAYLTAMPDAELDIEALRTPLQAVLPEYMVPSAFVILDALPLTPNGKLDRQALPAPDMTEIAKDRAAPVTETEKTLAAIWSWILGIEHISRQDDFFTLGGHSLLAPQLLVAVQKQFNIQLPLKSFFEMPTVAAQARLIDTGESGEALVDLEAEAILDAALSPLSSAPVNVAAANAVFLTGATGFLGTFLLAELLEQTHAKIYCLIRAANEQEALARLQRQIGYYELQDKVDWCRVIAVCGDLAKPRLGLSELRYEEIAEQVEAIYHNGAQVNFIQPYKTLKAANVLGSKEVLRLACYGKTKAIHYISTLSVFSEAPVVNPHGYQENDEPKLSGNLVNGYAQSKWVAEKMMRSARDRGFQVSIYRPASIAGDSRTGAWNTEDFLCRLIKGCIQTGYAPVEHIRMDMASVDYVSQAIVALSLLPSSIGCCFHLNHPVPPYLDELFDGFNQLGYHLNRIPYQDWVKKVLETSDAHHKDFALSPLLTLFVGRNRNDGAELLEKNTIHYDCSETQGILSKLGIECALMDGELLARYQAYFMRNGFIRDPEYYKLVF